MSMSTTEVTGALTSTHIERRKKPLSACVEASLARYFDDLDGQPPGDLYHLVLSEIERPLLTAVMRHTRGNQSQASELLGINRGTLRKKLKTYGLD